MDASTVTATGATVIAMAALVVSISESRSSREHNRMSVRPLLQLHTTREFGRPAGIVLYNQGLGPAIIKSTQLVLDGEILGSWDLPNYRKLRDQLAVWPQVTIFNDRDAVPSNKEVDLFVLPQYDRKLHKAFWDLVSETIHLVIAYQSLYGEDFRVRLTPSAPRLT